MKHFRILAGACLLILVGSAAAYTDVSGNVSGQHWPAGTYRVTGNLTINTDDSLSLAPGAVLKFLPGTGMTCNGTLLAQGLADSLIVFTSRDDDGHGTVLPDSDGLPTPGDWNGLYLYGYMARQGSGRFDHALLRYGGGSASWAANLYISYSDETDFLRSRSEHSLRHGMRVSAGRVHLEDSDFHGNGENGLLAQSSAQVAASDCRFTDNGGDGARLTGVQVLQLAGHAGSGNGLDGMAVSGSINGRVAIHAGAADFPYVLAGTLAAGSTDTLEIHAGCVFKAEASAALTCEGVLRLPGSQAEPIVFTALADDSVAGDTNGDGDATSPAPGAWNGIYLFGYLARLGIVEASWTTFRYGGAGSYNSNLYINYSDRATFEYCRFEHSLQHGLRGSNSPGQLVNCAFHANLGSGASGSSSLLSFTDCSFTDNALYAAQLSSALPAHGGGNSGSGNGLGGISMSGSSSGSIDWPANDPDFCYLLGGTATVVSSDTLRLGPGTVVKGEAGSQLRIDGVLMAPGTAEAPIHLTSLADDSVGGDANNDGAASAPAPGDWNGIYLYGYLSRPGSAYLDHCHLRFGGSGDQAILYASYSDESILRHCRIDYSLHSGLRQNDGLLTLEHCGFAGNLLHGITATSVTSPSIQDCSFDDNGGYGAWLTGSFRDMGGNSGSGNGINGIGLQGSSSGSCRWTANTGAFAYVLTGSPQFDSGDTLRLGAGVLIKGEPSSKLRITGILLAGGTPEEPVLFTSIRDDEWGGDTNGDGEATVPAPGDWQGLEFYGYLSPEGAADMEHFALRYAGGSPLNAGIVFSSSDWARLRHGEIRLNAQHGLQTSGSPVVVGHCRIVDNLGPGVHVASGQPVFGALDHSAGGYNTFDGNDGGNFQFWNNSTNEIEAAFNDWGVYDAQAIDQRIRDDDEANVGAVLFTPFVIDEGAPWIASITADDSLGTVALTWTPVKQAIGYRVYSLDHGYENFELDESGVYNQASWLAPLPGSQRFYQVTALMPDEE
jgi:hypothetical protein